MDENKNATLKSATGNYRPRLSYYHANARGTGAAVRFELHPAHDNVDGHIFCTFARQLTTGATQGGVRTFATFDWANRLTVKLDINDLAQMLQVFRGMQEAIADGKGLYHSLERSSTVIRLEHRLEPIVGYSFEVSRKLSTGELVRMGITFSPTEALGLSLAIEQSMGILAFGLGMVRNRAPAAIQSAIAPGLSAEVGEGQESRTEACA